MQFPRTIPGRRGILLFALCASSLGLSGCFVVEGAAPAVDASTLYLSQFNHRGMVQVDGDVAQGEMRVSLPTIDDGTLTALAFANVNLRDDIGDSWFPQNKSGKPTEIDLGLSYSRGVGPVDLTVGFLTYALPDGREFPNGVRGTTTEIFSTIAGELFGFLPSLTIHYDGDEIDGFYVNAGVKRPFEFGDRFALEVGASLGYSDDDQSDWSYGIDTGGLADLQGKAQLFYTFNDNTTFTGGVAGSTIIDSDIERWFDVIGIESDNVWAFLGILWAF